MSDDARTSPAIERDEHDTATSTKRTLPYTWNNTTTVRTPTPFIDLAYDYIVVTYPDSVTEVYTFKTGGSGGTTVRTVTVVYTAADKNNLSTVART
jgi:hypothetical protein